MDGWMNEKKWMKINHLGKKVGPRSSSQSTTIWVLMYQKLEST